MYYVFYSDRYYPACGAEDFIFKSEDLTSCLAYLREWVSKMNHTSFVWNIADENMEVVWSNETLDIKE